MFKFPLLIWVLWSVRTFWASEYVIAVLNTVPTKLYLRVRRLRIFLPYGEVLDVRLSGKLCNKNQNSQWSTSIQKGQKSSRLLIFWQRTGPERPKKRHTNLSSKPMIEFDAGNPEKKHNFSKVVQNSTGYLFISKSMNPQYERICLQSRVMRRVRIDSLSIIINLLGKSDNLDLAPLNCINLLPKHPPKPRSMGRSHFFTN